MHGKQALVVLPLTEQVLSFFFFLRRTSVKYIAYFFFFLLRLFQKRNILEGRKKKLERSNNISGFYELY